jgi:hypothetical protein
MSFFTDKIIPGVLTLNEFLLIPYYSEALPLQRGFTYWFTRCIRFNSPIDMVTCIIESPNYISR